MCDQWVLGIILTLPGNMTFGRNPECPVKTHNFRQSGDLIKAETHRIFLFSLTDNFDPAGLSFLNI
jgi:hypothetical protein